ncbi:hypothetical protein HN681_02970 [archaeon]|jgi:uncharacterized protein|nr:hypothetical protein [archaeon]MBT3731222.1 hypothetical protein [archaeon]MBT4670024.1 hypothetical protein [archaeon]MBT5287774.1 hypothetical protein [archaeon]MBT7052779.1 hypothetical protein [archaeon]
MEELIEELCLIISDNSIPKNVKAKVNSALSALKEEDVETCLRANKALQELDDLSEDPNVPSYLRPQIWNIVSQLETL